MAKGDLVPREDHVSVYCKATSLDNGIPQAPAFTVTETNQELSTNWIEFLGVANREAAIVEILRCLRSKLRIRRGALAVFNVGSVIDSLQAHLALRAWIEHDPEHTDRYHDPSHAVLAGIPFDIPTANAVGELIAARILETHPVTPEA